MTEANCRKRASEIVECARTGAEPDAELRGHLVECSRCSERWEDERKLSSEFRMLRDAARFRRPSEARRIRILGEFEAAQRRSSRPWLKWTAAAAAILLLAIGSLVETRRSGPHRGLNRAKATMAQEGAAEIEGLPADSSGFVAVPYAPPLATGEFVSVVRTELQPTALARMGIYVDASYTADIPADVVVGEDGLPRAVRVIEAIDF